MARNRVIYANEVLMVSPSATGYQFLNGNDDEVRGYHGESLLRQLKRVQNVNYSLSIDRQKVYQYGQLGCIDMAVINAPDVSLDFSYLFTDGQNEHLLGFNNADGTNFISKDFAADRDGRNFYIYTSPQANDAAVPNDDPATRISKMEAQKTGEKSVISLGNCYITNYSINASVGALPTVSVSAEAFNIKSDVRSGAFFGAAMSPGVDVTGGIESPNNFKIPYEYISSGEGITAIRPGDISVDIGNSSLLAQLSDAAGRHGAHIQSIALDVPLSRTTLQRVGNAFPISKVLDTPIAASVSVSAVLADRKSATQSLFTETYADNKNDLTITLRKPSSAGAGLGDKLAIFTITDAILESESYGMGIGDGRTVDFTFRAAIADPSADTPVGATVKLQSSGVYELLQVFETGVATDAANEEKNEIGYGTAIAANDEILVVGASGFKHLGEEVDVGAVYIYKNQKGMYTQQQLVSGAAAEYAGVSLNYANYLPGPGGNWDSHFGFDVAVSPQNLIAVGSRGTDDSGGEETSAVAIYHPNSDTTSWTIRDVETGIADRGTSIHLGQSLAFDKELSGTTQWLVAGAPLAGSGANEIGNVHVRYGTKGETNSFIGYPLDMGNTEVAGATVHDENERFGTSVAMHKTVIVVGAPGYADQSGVAYVYAADGTGPHTAAASWLEVAKLTGATSEDADPSFGQAVDIYKNTIVVGAPSGAGGTADGEVYVFTSDESPVYRGWTYAAKITPGDPEDGDLFGNAVSMPNSNTIVVAAPYEDELPPSPDNAGSVYVFTGEGSNWAQTQKMTYSGASDDDFYGFYQSSLAATQKEIFVAGEPGIDFGPFGNPEKVIRYRI